MFTPHCGSVGLLQNCHVSFQKSSRAAWPRIAHVRHVKFLFDPREGRWGTLVTLRKKVIAA
jgi:hypothetical protein